MPGEQSSDPEAVARQIGLRMLDRAPRTRAELATAMARRGIPDDAASAVLDRFTEVGLVDDAGFATAWVDSRHHGRGLARRALAAELRSRGVDDQVAKDALAAVSTDDEYVAACSLVRRRLRSMSGLPPEVVKRRLVAMLGRKGFGSGLAYRVVAEVIDDHRAVP
ncbi:MAG TPA: regulatory protein RecX [Mycobacteriales bacterium]|nr:regulatory protein RecX [Mycobacteriales bacterium]